MVRYSVYVGDNLPYVKVGDIGMDLEVDGEDRDVKFFGLDWDFVYKRNSYEKVYKVVFDSPETLPTGKQKVKLKIKSDFTISDSDIEKFVNGIVAYLKANRSGDDTVMEEVSGEDIRFWYNRDNYQSTKGQLGNSCMSYDYCQEYLDIYCDNPKKVSMLVLLTKDRMLIGRALLWRLDNGRRFMDRVYTILDSDARVFTDHARNNGWLYKEKYGGRYKIMDGKKEFEEHLSVTLQNHDFRHYPYLDTLKYLSYDGVLSDVGDSDDKFLNSTDGEYEYDE
jgi:hypothetical protein